MYVFRAVGICSSMLWIAHLPCIITFHFFAPSTSSSTTSTSSFSSSSPAAAPATATAAASATSTYGTRTGHKEAWMWGF